MSQFAHSLDPIFRPRSVAVIGASDTPGRVGHMLMRNLLGNPFGGVVYPINPNRTSVLGVRTYADLHSAPEPVDLAVIATPAATVPAQVRACVACGAQSAIVISAGFSELGTEGKLLQEQVREIAYGQLRLIGPNCLGVIHPPSNLNASFAAGMARAGHVALLSQSGAICTSILDWSKSVNIGFSTFVSVGAMIDVDFGALIDYFGDDPATHSIVMYMESIGNVPSFLSAARSVARNKPIIVVKAGRHEASAKAAASHTGALAGSDAVFDAALRRVGVLRVTTIRDLFDMSEILAMQPQPAGPGLCIVTNAGGLGVMAVDALMSEGGQLAELTAHSIEKLNRALPQFWSHGNPVDILGDADAERYRQSVEICAADANVQGLLILLAPQAMTNSVKTAELLASVAGKRNKPVLACWMGGGVVQPGRELLHKLGIPTFDTPEAAIRAFMHMVGFRRAQDTLYETPAATPELTPDTPAIERIITTARCENRRLLTEPEAKNVLAAYGIPVVSTHVASSAEGAVASAEQLGFPVVIKLLSKVITHKSDASGVQLNLADADSVRQAFERIRKNAVAYAEAKGIQAEADEVFSGVAVQPMVISSGYELILGSSIDVQFGPVILFGAGGVLVEVVRDRALALPPLTQSLARQLIERTTIAKALHGVRGRRGIDLANLATLIVRFSQLVADRREIAELDINPLLASPDQIIALDARVLLSEIGADPAPLAITPYPCQYTTQVTLNDGEMITIRAIRPDDEPLIVDHHAMLSEESIRRRYFSMVKLLTRERLIRLCHLDYGREMGLVAVHANSTGARILGVSRYYLDPESGTAEFAVVVSDPNQGRGIGNQLMRRLITVAKDRGIRRLIGVVLSENQPMLDLLRHLGFTVQPGDDPTTMITSLTL